MIEAIVWSKVFNVYNNILFLVRSKVNSLSGFQSSTIIGDWLGLGAYLRMKFVARLSVVLLSGCYGWFSLGWMLLASFG